MPTLFYNSYDCWDDRIPVERLKKEYPPGTVLRSLTTSKELTVVGYGISRWSKKTEDVVLILIPLHREEERINPHEISWIAEEYREQVNTDKYNVTWIHESSVSEYYTVHPPDSKTMRSIVDVPTYWNF